MTEPDVPDVPAEGADGGGTMRERLRPGVAIAVVVGVVVAALLAVGVHSAGSDGGPNLQSGRGGEDDKTTTTTALDDTARAVGGPEFETTTTTSEPAETTSTTEAPATSTTLPGVVDKSHPDAVTEALVDLAATGVEPTEGTVYLQGGNPEIARELFMFAREGLASSRVYGCGTSGASAHCSASLEASYGAKATAKVSLTRANTRVPWTVSRIQMSPN